MKHRKSCTSNRLWNHGPLHTARDGCTCTVLMETNRYLDSAIVVTRSRLTRFARVFSVDVTGRREASIGHGKDYGTVLVDVRGAGSGVKDGGDERSSLADEKRSGLPFAFVAQGGVHTVEHCQMRIDGGSSLDDRLRPRRMRDESPNLVGPVDYGREGCVTRAETEATIVVLVDIVNCRTREAARPSYQAGNTGHRTPGIRCSALLRHDGAAINTRGSMPVSMTYDPWLRGMGQGMGRLIGCHGPLNLGRHSRRMAITDRVARHFADFWRTWESGKQKQTGLPGRFTSS